MIEVLFWLSVAGVIYPYAGYPLVLWLLARWAPVRHRAEAPPVPGVSMIVPFHNEAARVSKKLANTAALRYPPGLLQVLLVSDGSTDSTAAELRAHATEYMTVIEQPVRRGKAAALNAGLALARHELLVFSDASIALEPDALLRIVEPFRDGTVGVASGEDRIADAGGEGWYGRYELLLRRLESRVGSIVGASGSFYAQKRGLCDPFVEGMAPDFLSVLRTVERGHRAVSEPAAIGSMTSVKDTAREFERKVRTSIRGMTTLFAHAWLLNPFRYGSFALQLWSHKVCRWLVPFWLAIAIVTAALLSASSIYAVLFGLQLLFYLGAAGAYAQLAGLHRSLPGKIAVYFTAVNAALLLAWVKYIGGARQELWTPSGR